MNVLHPIESLRESRERKIKEQANLQAEIIGSEIVELVRKTDKDGPYPLPAGELPKAAHGEEYLGYIASRVISTLERAKLDQSIEYDPEATRLASTEMVTYPDGHWNNEPKRDNLTIVFNRTV